MLWGSRTRLFALLGFTAVVSACAGGPPRGEEGVKGQLYTETLAGDIRLFRFVILRPEPPLRPITQRNPQGPGASAPRPQDDQETLERVERSLAKLPELRAFCPNGYTVIEKYAILNELVVRGECKYQ